MLHDDGIVFMLHHVATGALAVFALQPYLHLYAPFFFGISEISTLFIAVLVLFDEHHGIKELGERFPLLMSATGVIFAVLFGRVRRCLCQRSDLRSGFVARSLNVICFDAFRSFFSM